MPSPPIIPGQTHHSHIVPNQVVFFCPQTNPMPTCISPAEGENVHKASNVRQGHSRERTTQWDGYNQYVCLPEYVPVAVPRSRMVKFSLIFPKSSPG